MKTHKQEQEKERERELENKKERELRDTENDTFPVLAKQLFAKTNLPYICSNNVRLVRFYRQSLGKAYTPCTRSPLLPKHEPTDIMCKVLLSALTKGFATLAPRKFRGNDQRD